ncbi:MAG: type II toxin-antitoxin system RelE/ParE family toxin [Rhizobiaceae bacterium]
MLQLKQTAAYMKWERKLTDQTAKALIAARLLRLANGLAGDVSPIGDGLSELRIHYGPGYRIYFQRRGSVIIVLLCGGDKSTQSKDIARAKEIAREWSDNND